MLWTLDSRDFRFQACICLKRKSIEDGPGFQLSTPEPTNSALNIVKNKVRQEGHDNLVSFPRHAGQSSLTTLRVRFGISGFTFELRSFQAIFSLSPLSPIRR